MEKRPQVNCLKSNFIPGIELRKRESEIRLTVRVRYGDGAPQREKESITLSRESPGRWPAATAQQPD